MTSCYIFKQQISVYVEHLYNCKSIAENARLREHTAAVKIQSWYKGIKLRCYLKNLNKGATTIQRHWRGCTGRKKFRIFLKDACDNMCIRKYNDSATMIQKQWKGFYERKYTFNYYKYKKYLSDLELKNNHTLKFIDEYQQNQQKENEINREVQQLNYMKSWAVKNHYLISTKVQPGVFNSPFNKNQFQKEYLLKESERILSKNMKPYRPFDKSNIGFEYDPACTIITEKPLSRHLPPLPSFAPQGPFKDPKGVFKQRYKGLNPSLRVMTDFESLEKARIAMKKDEWTKRLHDDPFLPVINRNPPYEPLLLTSTVYGHIAYGSSHFREESKLTGENVAFKNIVPPIQVFDKLNKQYVENYSI